MTFELSLEEGAYLVRLARRAIEVGPGVGGAAEPVDSLEKLMRPHGVFVTLNKAEGSAHKLRGCIGFPYPEKPLAEAVIESARSAAFKDPRFSPISLGEMDSIIVEVSVLTPPEPVMVDRPDRYPDHIKVGRDGLIVRRGSRRGLLLPQVPIEWGWDAEEFLTQCCLKAWLPPDAWLIPGTEIAKFQALIFEEETPRGAVRRKKLHSH